MGAVRLYRLQLEVYRSVLSSKRFSSVLSRHGSGSGGDPEGVLPAITLLRKLCNHPALLVPDGGALPPADPEAEQSGHGQTVKLADVAASVLARQLASSGQQLTTVELSGAHWLSVGVAVCRAQTRLSCQAPALSPAGKLATLAALLQSALAAGSRVVVVSTSTAALDVVDRLLCAPRGCAHGVRCCGGGQQGARVRAHVAVCMRKSARVWPRRLRAGGAACASTAARAWTSGRRLWTTSTRAALAT